MIQSSDNRDTGDVSGPRNGILSLDDIFDVLASPRRRAALYVLCKQSKPMGVAALSNAVAKTERNDGREDCPSEVAITLTHVHLPKFEQFSLVSYDREAKTVELNPLPRRFRRYLWSAAEDEIEARVEDATA